MNVVTRGLMVAGLILYAGIHGLEVFRGADDAPGWLAAAFLLSAIAAVALAVALLARSGTGRTRVYQGLAAALALASAIALVLAYTVGLLGVEEEVRLGPLGAMVAELVILLSWLAGRVAGKEFDEVRGPVADPSRELH